MSGNVITKPPPVQKNPVFLAGLNNIYSGLLSYRYALTDGRVEHAVLDVIHGGTVSMARRS